MSDIQQWRRKIQPARSRTPATLYEVDDLEDTFSTSTPKKRVKPKLSTYFSNNAKPTLHEEVAAVEDFPDLPSWPPEQTYPDPQPEELMNGIMSRIMSNPYQALDTCHHSSLMMIFESYGQLLEQNALVQRRLDADAATIQTLITKLDEAEQEWNEERLEYKDEVKRLEVLLAKESRRGLAEVTLARQDSKLRHRMSQGLDKKETIFEFLEKSNLHDDRYHSQRAIMKPAPMIKVANDKDKQASQQQQLVQKKSMTHLHAELPFGTPPRDTRKPLTSAARLAQQQDMRTGGRKRATTSSTIQSTSEDTFSTFSCESDTIPDQTLRPAAKSAPANEDYASIESIATTLASRRNIDPALVIPQLLQLFNGQGLQYDRAASDPVKLLVQAPYPERSSSMLAPVDMAAPKQHRTVMSKASGFFHKLVPQLSVDVHSAQPSRRFSFEPGDDIEPANHSTGVSNPIGKDRILQKSVSADGLRRSETTTSARALSPVVPSPTSSAFMEGRTGTPSRIPTPVFTSGSLAKPRQEREESASSLLTVIQYNGTRSVSSSNYSSPESSRNLARAAEEVLTVQTPMSLHSSNSTNRLNSLRGMDLAAAAARTASGGEADASPNKAHFNKRARSQYGHYGHSARLTTAILQDENVQPPT